MSRNTLFVGNLSFDTSERELEQEFRRFGDIVRCEVKVFNPSCFAFVEYQEARDAEEASRRLHGIKLNSRSITVEFAKADLSRRGRDGSCFRCGQTGHVARDCREPESDRSRGSGRDGDRSRNGRDGDRRGRGGDRYDDRPRRRERSGERDNRRRDNSRSRSPSYRRRDRSPVRPRSRSPANRRMSVSPATTSNERKEKAAPEETKDASDSASPNVQQNGSRDGENWE
ncbi:hypothetical protein H4R33_003598 [Dimargaris cristalligena]|uniref:RRM domain-containing protein n=1 Tax=Dimargaris cristalligena TaxID=215637 RepID=A0A4Q0A0M5_9FUNG|nr:hypothetical protein H4R33_003598 [Dimargaris cristalligena]RKP39593.1 hypothetical protein BJ085DRAFT_38117 [Dimargaris cristalligena]|eukprot:RKP39593.1 hypothetical protein BJ085DRAFT_38117 [Dimargaris cristalligena]